MPATSAEAINFLIFIYIGTLGVTSRYLIFLNGKCLRYQSAFSGFASTMTAEQPLPATPRCISMAFLNPW